MYVSKTTILVSALAAVFTVAFNAQAYNLKTVASGNYVKWSVNNITMQVHSDTWDDANRRDAVQDAIDLWEDNPSNFWFSAAEDDDGWALSNNENELAWTGDAAVLGGSPAICYTTWNSSTGALIEADVFMSTGTTYTNSNTKTNLISYGGASRPAQTTLIHELGHALGLGHVSTLYNIMGRDWTHIHANSSTATAYVGEDASKGAVVLYGKYSYQDLAVAHWRRTGASGEYSVHSRNRILDSSGTALTQYTSDNEPYYQLQKGQTYRPEVTFENNGADSQTTAVAYFLSTNSYITTLDTEIYRISTVNWSPDVPYLGTYAVTIPAGTSTGTYWLGVITDVDDTLSETRADNNATYIAKVYIY